MKAFEHYKTIHHHKQLVMKGCFAVGLYRQGLLHDLSKLSPTEFLVGAKYYKGTESPNNGERLDKGYSLAWLHHKGRNKHHFEYWIDYDVRSDSEGMVGMRMPVNYVVETYIDRVAASKNYQKEKYTNDSAWNYYLRGRKKYIIHPETQALLEYLLFMLKERGEDAVNQYIIHHVLNHPENRDIYPLLPNYDYANHKPVEPSPDMLS